MTVKRLIGFARGAQRLARAPGLSPLAKARIFWMRATRRLFKCAHDYPLALGPGTLHLDPCHDADVTALDEIFVQRQYAADYRRAVVLDLGAHKGCFTLFAAMGQADWVLAFEPEERNFQVLTRAARSARGTRCLLYREAVAPRDGELDFFVTGQSWSHSLFPRVGRGDTRRVRVKTRTLDSAVLEARRVGGDDKRLIVKMDVEGAEWDVLHAASDGALGGIDELYVEIHPREGHDVPRLLARLARAGLSPAASGFDNILHLRRASGVSAVPA